MKAIKQSVFFKASPHDVFEALMDSKKHSEFTGSEAKISRHVGGEFSAYDGSIFGRNVEIVEDEKIVQEWYCDTEGWPRGHFSTVTFSLKKENGGTRLEFLQINVPDDAFEDI